MEQQIADIIRQLGMPQAAFVVAVQTDEAAGPTPVGADSVEFLVSANPGMPPRSLARVASGGELSRISLAIQVATLEGKSVPTLVFDEVDTGIGGGIAEVVGHKLRLLGEDRQVFCVTHLPQVAAQGHQHLLVQKQTSGEGTQSSVLALEADQRTAEIARMLGGVRITEQTLAHAREMLSLALDSHAGSGSLSGG
jgi:DNA repair protein RecN (Recombination protein N)